MACINLRLLGWGGPNVWRDPFPRFRPSLGLLSQISLRSVRPEANVPELGAAFARFRDPVSFELPEGWTYTLASDAETAAPEPGTLALVVTGLIGVGAIYRRTRRT